MGKTVHVVPSGKGWAVKGDGISERETLFATQKDALARARSIVQERASGQIAVHSKTGRFAASGVRGLPKIPKSPVKSSLGSDDIQRAVSKLVRERLA